MDNQCYPLMTLMRMKLISLVDLIIHFLFYVVHWPGLFYATSLLNYIFFFFFFFFLQNSGVSVLPPSFPIRTRNHDNMNYNRVVLIYYILFFYHNINNKNNIIIMSVELLILKL